MRMRVLATTALLACALTAATSSADAAPAAPAHPPRAMWVWDQPPVGSLVRFAKRQGLDDVFVFAPSGMTRSGDLAWFTRLHRRTDAAGISLQALNGEPGWARRPRVVLRWQREMEASGLFDGLHLDIEPWGLPGWREHRHQLARQYVRVLGRVSRASTLPVEADVAFWLGGIRVNHQRLDRLVLERVDAVTVMTYRHRVRGADSITGLGSRTLDVGRRVGTPVRLAVETNYLGDDPVDRKQTFHGRTRADLARALARVDRIEARAAAYGGMAVHDRAGWVALDR